MGAEQSRGGPAVANACPSGVTTLGPNLQKKFSKGVQYNMKVIIKGDRNVGKSCLFQRLQGHKFSEEYVATPEIQVACIQWNYKVTDDVVKVEIWDIVDKGKQKKREGLKMADTEETAPALDAAFIDVFKGTSGVIMMLDITKYWTYEYVQRELPRVPLDIPVIVMASHRDMEDKRSVLSEDVQAFIKEMDRPAHAAAVYYMEASMRDGFGLKYLYRFFNIPFLELQRQTLLAQLKRNEEDLEAIKVELDVHGQSDEQDYDKFRDTVELKKKGAAGGLTTVSAGCNEAADSTASSEGTEASTLEEGGAMSLRSRLSQKVLQKAPLPATARLEPNSNKLDSFVPEGNLDNSFLGSTQASREPSPKPVRDRPKIGDIQLSDSDDEGAANPQVTLDQESPDEADIVIITGDEAVGASSDDEPVVAIYNEEPDVSYEEIKHSKPPSPVRPPIQRSAQPPSPPIRPTPPPLMSTPSESPPPDALSTPPDALSTPPETPPTTPSAIILSPAPLHSIDPILSPSALVTPLAVDYDELDAYDGLSNELDLLDKISCAPPMPNTVTTSSESEPPPAKVIQPVKKVKKKLKAPPKKSLLDINLTSSDEDASFNEPADETVSETVVMSTWDEPEVRAPVARTNSLKLVHVDTAPVVQAVPQPVPYEEPPAPLPVVKQKKPKKEKVVVRTEQDELDDFFGESTPKEAPAAKEPKVKKEKKGKKKKKKTAAVADTGYEEF